jgi:hypothetical protein
MKKLSLSVVLLATSAAAVSCGGRTWDTSGDNELPTPDAGQGGSSGFGEGGTVASGGVVVGAGGTAVVGGRPGYGGTIVIGGRPGTGGRPYSSGGAGFGAIGGNGTGAYYGTGGYYGYGGYYGTGGYYGYGGYYGTGGSNIVCPAEVCPADVLSPCCTGTGFCGVGLPMTTPAYGIDPGCHQLNEPGNVDYSCPSFATLNGTGLPDFPGCCRPDGTCGFNIYQPQLPLGCVQVRSSSGAFFGCKPLGGGGFAGAGGATAIGGGTSIGTGGTIAIGGTTSVGGKTAAGGTIAIGGRTAAGGTIAIGGGAGTVATGGFAGAAAQQCVSQARSDCERCACSSCYDSLIPCFKDAMCPQILACANRTGCTGIDCYQSNTCQAIIDKAGGVGSTSVSLALPLFACVTNTSCPCGFK